MNKMVVLINKMHSVILEADLRVANVSPISNKDSTGKCGNDKQVCLVSILSKKMKQ